MRCSRTWLASAPGPAGRGSGRGRRRPRSRAAARRGPSRGRSRVRCRAGGRGCARWPSTLRGQDRRPGPWRAYAHAGGPRRLAGPRRRLPAISPVACEAPLTPGEPARYTRVRSRKRLCMKTPDRPSPRFLLVLAPDPAPALVAATPPRARRAQPATDSRSVRGTIGRNETLASALDGLLSPTGGRSGWSQRPARSTTSPGSPSGGLSASRSGPTGCSAPSPTGSTSCARCAWCATARAWGPRSSPASTRRASRPSPARSSRACSGRSRTPARSDQLALDLADIYAWDVDFNTEIQRGDSFRVVVEKLSVDGAFARYGRILAAEFVRGDRVLRAFRHEGAGGAGYYDAEGRPLRKAFLRSPLRFTRISSRFSRRACTRSCTSAGPTWAWTTRPRGHARVARPPTGRERRGLDGRLRPNRAHPPRQRLRDALRAPLAHRRARGPARGAGRAHRGRRRDGPRDGTAPRLPHVPQRPVRRPAAARVRRPPSPCPQSERSAFAETLRRSAALLGVAERTASR